jgi:hypothetical protein
MYSRNLIAAVCLGVCASSAFAADDQIDYSLSIKSWNADVKVDLGAAGSGSTTKGNSPIIGLTARKGDYFASASTLLETSYNFNTATISRKDYDISVGYRATENVSVIGGYKALTMTDHSIANYVEEHTGIYAGLAGFKLLNSTDFIYGNFWIAPNMTSSGTAAVDKMDNFKAQNYEIGFGRALTPSTQVTIGYRAQEMKTNNKTQNRSEVYTMKGILVGLNVNF